MKTSVVSNSFLKTVAYITMLIDHVSVVLVLACVQTAMREGRPAETWLEVYHVGRHIGRIAFILFAFMIAEGFCYTRDRKKYLFRLGIFALISEIPFDLAVNGVVFETGNQNVYFTLFLGALALCMIEKMKNYWLLQVAGILLCAVLACLLRTDYMLMGVLLIAAFYLCRGNFWRQFTVCCVVIYFGTFLNYMLEYRMKGMAPDVLWLLEGSTNELYGLLAFVLIYFYNGQKGKQLPKLCYYLFYPVHLLLLFGIGAFLFRGTRTF